MKSSEVSQPPLLAQPSSERLALVRKPFFSRQGALIAFKRYSGVDVWKPLCLKLDSGFLPGIFSRGVKSIVMQISIVMLIFYLEQIIGE